MAASGFTAPSLPSSHGRRWHADELAKLDADSGTGIFTIEALSAVYQTFLNPSISGAGDPLRTGLVELILNRGIETTEFDPVPQVDVLDASRAAHVFADNIPLGVGMVVDANNQPFPVFGFMDVRWESTGVNA